MMMAPRAELWSLSGMDVQMPRPLETSPDVHTRASALQRFILHTAFRNC